MGPSTTSQISSRTWRKGLPVLATREGLVVTPSRTPIDWALRISSISALSMKNFMIRSGIGVRRPPTTTAAGAEPPRQQPPSLVHARRVFVPPPFSDRHAEGRDFRHGLPAHRRGRRSEEQTSELQSRENIVCRLLLEKKKRAERYR